MCRHEKYAFELYRYSCFCCFFCVFVLVRQFLIEVVENVWNDWAKLRLHTRIRWARLCASALWWNSSVLYQFCTRNIITKKQQIINHLQASNPIIIVWHSLRRWFYVRTHALASLVLLRCRFVDNSLTKPHIFDSSNTTHQFINLFTHIRRSRETHHGIYCSHQFFINKLMSNKVITVISSLVSRSVSLFYYYIFNTCFFEVFLSLSLARHSLSICSSCLPFVWRQQNVLHTRTPNNIEHKIPVDKLRKKIA